jgi:hypothetical protein
MTHIRVISHRLQHDRARARETTPATMAAANDRAAPAAKIFRVLKYTSHAIDTALATAAVMMNIESR